MSLFDKCRRYDRAQQILDAGLWPYFHPIQDTGDATEVLMRDRRVLMLGSNNYLGLTLHPKVSEAAHEAIRRFGTGCSGSRFLNGTLEMHHELEHELAEFMGKEAALVFSTGFQTNLGVLSVVAGRDDMIFCDRENHASIFDGVRLNFAPVRKYRHNDMDDLERLLADSPQGRGKLIVSDGVFSMHGDLVNLPRMRELADRYHARILIDDAHAIGVIGCEGRGTASHFGVDVDLITGTFSKSLASLGGFVVGDRDVVEFIKFNARPMIFSAAPTPANTATALAALRVMQSEPEHLARLIENVDYMRRGFREIGYDPDETPAAIIALPVGEDFETFTTWRRLFDEGVYANAVVTPAVPAGEGILRTSYMATHTREQLDRSLEIFQRVGRDLLVG